MQYQTNEKNSRSKAKRIILISIFVSQAIILSYFERFIPLQLLIPVPNVKLGLSNVIILTSLYVLTPYETFGVVLLKSYLVSLLFGSPLTFMFSLSGGILSLLVMTLLIKVCKNYVTPIGVSVSGAIFHNIGQITMASIFMANKNIFYYLPYLIFTGVITGILIGLTVRYLLRYIVKLNFN